MTAQNAGAHPDAYPGAHPGVPPGTHAGVPMGEAASEGANRRRATGTERAASFAATAGVLGALFASSCCVAPLVLFSLGVSGAWIGNLAAFAPYQPYIIALTVVCLGVGFVMVYRRPAAMAEGASCAHPALGRITRPTLWLATVLVAVAAAFPYVAPGLLGIQ